MEDSTLANPGNHCYTTSRKRDGHGINTGILPDMSYIPPPSPTSCSTTHPLPVTHLPIGSARACLNPVRYKYPTHSNPCHTLSSLPVRIFNAILLTHHFPSLWKHARVTSILKPGKDPALPSSYRPISLLDSIGKLFEKIILASILHEVSERGLMRDEHLGSDPSIARPCSWPVSLKE